MARTKNTALKIDSKISAKSGKIVRRLKLVTKKSLKKKTLAKRSTAKKSMLAKAQAPAQILVFPVERTRGYELTDEQRAELILEHRVKAKRLAQSMLRRWRSRIEMSEIESVVDLSLCETAARFSPNKGASFMTFFYYHLKGNLVRAVSDAANHMTVPLFEREMVESHSGQSSSMNPIANAIEVAEALVSKEQHLPDETLYRKEIARRSIEACQRLDVLEQEIIFRVLVDEEQLNDVASELGYSRCHISRVKRRALELLEKSLQDVRPAHIKEKNVILAKTPRRVTRRGDAHKDILKERDNKHDSIFAQASNS